MNTDFEDTKLTASCIEGDRLVYSHDHNPPPCDLGHVDQIKENEVEASKQPSPSVPKEVFESNMLAPAINTEEGTSSASAAGEMSTSHQSVSLLETSSVTIPNDASKQLNKQMVNSADTAIAQDAGVESAPTKKPMEAETERNLGANSSALSGVLLIFQMHISLMVVKLYAFLDPHILSYPWTAQGRGIY